MGINAFQDGDILLDGISIKTDDVLYKQNIAYIPDNPILYDQLTGIQYLNFVADIYDVPTLKREELIKKYAKKFEIYDVLGNLISSYSHGMKQKISIISALIHDPKLYVLDEPFVGLDPVSSYNLKQILKEKAKEGKIVFFSTHVLEVAQKLCNKIAIIKSGNLVVDGFMNKVTKDKDLEEIYMEIEKND